MPSMLPPIFHVAGMKPGCNPLLAAFSVPSGKLVRLQKTARRNNLLYQQEVLLGQAIFILSTKSISLTFAPRVA